MAGKITQTERELIPALIFFWVRLLGKSWGGQETKHRDAGQLTHDVELPRRKGNKDMLGFFRSTPTNAGRVILIATLPP